MLRHGKSMFTRLFSVFLCSTLLCAVCLFAVMYVHLRSVSIENRMDALKTQARDMAYLASRMTNETIPRAFGRSSETEKYMMWKANNVYNEYNAYIIVIDRNGAQRTYYNESTLRDESMRYMPSQEEISAYLSRVISGEEIVIQTDSRMGPLFTVIVPWTQENVLTNSKTVMGLVLIQTAAQTVHAAYRSLIWQYAMVILGLAVLIGLLIFFLTRQTVRPLNAMVSAAQSMAQGNFSVRAPEEGSSEVRTLAVAFNQMAEQLNTLETSRREFVANVSHELRSPVTSIRGYAQGMLDGTIPPQDQAQYLQVISDETARLSKLISNLLNLSRLENDKTDLIYTVFDVNELTRQVLISRMTQIESKNLDIEADFDVDPCFVRADKDQIHQVLINLIDNAIKYTPDNGNIQMYNRVEDKTAVIGIRDNGIGISAEDAAHIFDRFYMADKTHTVGKGTGLGLPICKKIMDKHRQSIRLVSGDKGACFEFTLAVADDREVPHALTGKSEDQLDT